MKNPIIEAISKLDRDEVIQQLIAAGFVRAPGSWDTAGAKVWREQTEAEK